MKDGGKEKRRQRESDKAFASSESLNRELAGAIQMLGTLPSQDGEPPEHRLPWILMIPGSDADWSDVLNSASTSSSVPPPERQAGDDGHAWRCWILKSMVAIEVAAGLFGDSNHGKSDAGLSDAMELLRERRPQLPVNGIALLISAQVLLKGQRHAHRTWFKSLRMQFLKALEMAGVTVPLFLVIRGMEHLPGFSQFVEVLPAEASAQAVGLRLDTTSQKCESANEWQSGLADLALRFHAIRLGVLKREIEAEVKGAVFEFVANIEEVLEGIDEVAKILCEGKAGSAGYFCRALYLIGGGGQEMFIRDLFDRHLPADAALARRVQS